VDIHSVYCDSTSEKGVAAFFMSGLVSGGDVRMTNGPVGGPIVVVCAIPFLDVFSYEILTLIRTRRVRNNGDCDRQTENLYESICDRNKKTHKTQTQPHMAQEKNEKCFGMTFCVVPIHKKGTSRVLMPSNQ